MVAGGLRIVLPTYAARERFHRAAPAALHEPGAVPLAAVESTLQDDMALVGIEKLPGRATHGLRKAAISKVCNDDEGGMAPENVIKALSHTSRSRG